MRLTRPVAVGIAVVCGGLAALLSVVYLQSLQRQKAAPIPEKAMVEVVVPRVNIAPNTIITPDMLSTASVEEGQVPRGAIIDPAVIVGQVAIQRLTAQKPILSGQIAARSKAFGLAGIVPAGMRAVTVAVDPITGVAGLLKPGDRVDVIATFEVDETLIAHTILQDVELLALGTHTTNANGQPTAAPAEGEETEEVKAAAERKTVEYANATLSVSPEDAQKLLLADQRGKLRLALRPVGEHDYVPTATDDLGGIVGREHARRLMAREQAEAEEEKAREESAPAPPPWAWQQPPPEPARAPEPSPRAPSRADVTRTEPEVKPPPEVEVIRREQRERIVP